VQVTVQSCERQQTQLELNALPLNAFCITSS